jgi:hypothetical protein
MADLWRQARGEDTDEMRGVGHEDATYAAGWALSCAAVLGAVLVLWQLGL